MSLPIKKVYVDTRFRTNDSISTSQFKIELPDTLALPHNTIFHLDDISIPYTWYTVTEDVNDKLYIQMTTLNGTTSPPHVDVNSTNICKVITLSPGNYNGLDSFAKEIQLQANLQFYTTLVPAHFAVTVNVHTNTLVFTLINNTFAAKVFTNSDIKSKLDGYIANGWDGHWNGPHYDPNDSQNANELISNTDGIGYLFTKSIPFTTQYIDLQPIKNIYIHSANLGSYKTIGPKGESTIIKKVPVTAGPDSMIFSTVTSSSDYLDCSRQTLKTISFELKDAHGRIINLHGVNLSFSIVFDKYRSDVVN